MSRILMIGPGSVNIFRNMLGLQDAKWQEKEGGRELEQQQQQQYPAHDFKQLTLSDLQ